MADHLRSVIDTLSPEDQAEVASYMAARDEADRAEAEYVARLPGWLTGMVDAVSEGLPDGVRLQWTWPDA